MLISFRGSFGFYSVSCLFFVSESGPVKGEQPQLLVQHAYFRDSFDGQQVFSEQRDYIRKTVW